MDSPAIQLWTLLDTLDSLRQSGVTVKDPKGTGSIRVDRDASVYAAGVLGLSREYTCVILEGVPVKQARAIVRWALDKTAHIDAKLDQLQERRKMLTNWCEERRGIEVPDEVHFRAIHTIKEAS